MSDEDAERRRRLLLTRIALYGYTMVEVSSSKEASGSPTYAYTLGLPKKSGTPSWRSAASLRSRASS